jgi:hypothetical protein
MALTYIKSETTVLDSALQKDLITAYSNARVKVLKELSTGWYKDASAGDCYKVSIKAEVSPDMKSIGVTKLDTPIDLSWHKFKNRKLDIFVNNKLGVKVTTPVDGWRIIGPTDNKDEYDWAWEVTVAIADLRKKSVNDASVTIIEIKYILYDQDGFMLTTDTLNISHNNEYLAGNLWDTIDSDGTVVGSPSLLQGVGTTKVYRQKTKMYIEKASRVKFGKYQITVGL